MSEGITRRGSLKSAIAAFCAAPIAKLRAENGGHINATRFSDLAAGEEISDDTYLAALPAAERLALKIIASYGALSSDNGFHVAWSNFAEAHFGHKDAMKSLHEAIDAVRPYLPADQRFKLCDAIDNAANDLEMASWQAMWLVGICVGVRLGGGR